MPSSRCLASGCCRSASFSGGATVALKSGGGVCISGDWLLISCRSLAIRALDGSAACVGVSVKKSVAQLPTGLRRIGRVAATAPATPPPAAATTAPAPPPVAAAGGRLVACALCGRCGLG